MEIVEGYGEKAEQAILVGLNCSAFDEDENSNESTLNELESLLETAGGKAFAKVLQNRNAPDPYSFIGTGKAESIRDLAASNSIDLIVFDNELSPSQMKNLCDITNVRVIDRSALILDIFARRAMTSEGKLQIELAQYKYLLPRLSGLGAALSRLGGGIGTRGPGETKLETDRRHIRGRILKLQQEIEQIRHIRATQRRKRRKSGILHVALVGYTNAGKSTLLNTLTDAGIPARDRLFDTLDTTTRLLKVSDTLDVFLSDTVGFVRKLPHHLIDAFRATLEELDYADLILHVIDISNEEWRKQADAVDKTLSGLGLDGIPRIDVYNKADGTCADVFPRGENSVSISALYKTGTDRLLYKISDVLGKKAYNRDLVIPYHKAKILDMLYRDAKVLSAEYKEDGIHLAAVLNIEILGRVKDYVLNTREET